MTAMLENTMSTIAQRMDQQYRQSLCRTSYMPHQCGVKVERYTARTVERHDHVYNCTHVTNIARSIFVVLDMLQVNQSTFHRRES